MSSSNRCSTIPAGRTVWSSSIKGRSCTTPPGAGPLLSPSPASLRSSLSPPPILPSAGAGGASPLPGRDILPRFVSAPLPVRVARDPLPDPCGRPRLPRLLPPPSAASVGIDAVAPGVAGVALGWAGGGGECPGAVSLFPAVWEFPVATEIGYPGSVCYLCPGLPSAARAAPFGGVTPAAR